jgi:hypothetical protein
MIYFNANADPVSGGLGLADPGGAEAQPYVALAAHGVGELDEPAVFLGRDERAGAPPRCGAGRHALSSR